MLILTLCPLGAESWRYSILGENDGYVALVDSVISLMPYVDNVDMTKGVRERAERNERIKTEKKKAEYYEKENYTSLSTLSLSQVTIPERLEIEKVDTSFSDYSSLLRTGDTDTYEYLLSQNNLDALIYVKSEGEGTIREIEVIYNGGIIRKAFYTTSLFNYEEEALTDYFTSLLLSTDHNWHRINVDVPSVSIVIDGNVKTNSSDLIVLENGPHTFTLSASGYLDKTETIEVGEDRDINLTLSPLDSHSLYISTLPWSVNMRVNGEVSDGKFIQSIHSPYTISLSSPNFSHLTFQSNRMDESIDVELNPLWTEADEIIIEKKNDFYRSIFTSLLSF
ncbi:MAG: hypothetical protein ACI4NI_00120, partial [Candidatus Ornithospirochaeta sp.]